MKHDVSTAKTNVKYDVPVTGVEGKTKSMQPLSLLPTRLMILV
jgi:hypothetical protein